MVAKIYIVDVDHTFRYLMSAIVVYIFCDARYEAKGRHGDCSSWALRQHGGGENVYRV